MATQFTLGKNERLKSRKLIEQLFKSGKSFNAFPFRVFYLSQPSLFPLQFGTGVSNRNFKKAVDRNRIKRLTKEAWRLQKNILEESLKANNKSLSVFLIYTQKELPDYKTIYDKTGLILKKLIKIINETDSSNT
ncbi:MAG: ribonuclease P protein component [Bacteroidetes bacterium]|nr:ribonuclease P protein component [Bacteroidota bacterium]MBS1609750.1 ribonuclease P protein component [Bacteroidota bacterium]